MFKKMILILTSLVILLYADESAKVILKGSGATFPYPLYRKWIEEYSANNPVKILYEPVGSGAGIEDLLNNRVDFGATDVFLTDEELRGVDKKIVHIPTCLGAIVFTYNLPIEQSVKFSKNTLTGILSGEITQWNAPEIQADNPDLNLPDQKITLIHRSDESGTTYVLTSYLSKINHYWKENYGYGKHFQWRTGIGVEGNKNIAKYISRIPGSLGYLSFTYAQKENLPVARIENETGKYIYPTIASITKAGEIDIPDDARINLVASKNTNAYPISTFSYVIFFRNKQNPNTLNEKYKAGTEFFKWMLTHGQKYNELLFYAPVPDNVVQLVYKLLE